MNNNLENDFFIKNQKQEFTLQVLDAYDQRAGLHEFKVTFLVC